MTALTTLHLSNFRNHAGFEATGLPQRPIAIVGANGTGKTNVLEAISLLVPGRGLRGAKHTEWPLIGTPRFAIHAECATWAGAISLGTSGGTDHSERRKLRLNGVDAKQQAEVLQYLSVVWLTPQMGGLFLEASGERRRFYDRLVFAFDPAHAGRVNRYEQALSERSKILKGELGTPDATWLSSLEKTLAETAVAIAAARVEILYALRGALAQLQALNLPFPHGEITLVGDAETPLQKGLPALEIEEKLERSYAHSREGDAKHGGSTIGANRADFSMVLLPKNVPASLCSTGEQKALITLLLLAHAQHLKAERGHAPLLLMDDIAAHFDTTRLQLLADLFKPLQTQIWLSGTESAAFTAFDPHVIRL